jgi:hypothetical protein
VAVDTPQIKIDPYQSTVPTVQIPPQVIDQETRPAAPLPGQFGRPGTGALAIGDSLIKGFLLGHQQLADRKAKQAQATIAAADQSTEAAYQQYQDSISSGKDQATQEATYKNYLDTFNKAKETKAKFVLPEKPAKGQKKDAKKDGQQQQGQGGLGASIKDFFGANPHLVPQIALATMQPKPPGLSQDNQVRKLQTEALQTEVEAGKENLTATRENRQRAADAEARAESQRQVEANGGIDAVLNNKTADPKLQQTARMMKYAQLDAQSPEAKLKTQYEQQLLSGESKNWTPEQRVMAGQMGVVPLPVAQTVTGKNGHQQQILVDPTTNKPVPGSTPLDLGPPAWASEFYAKRAADRADLQKAVQGNPEAYGVTPSSDPKAMKAAIDAKVSELVVATEFGIKNVAGSTGKTGYEVQRDNTYLQDVVKAAGLNAKAGSSPLDTGQATMFYPVDAGGQKAGQPFAVGREYFNKILTSYTTNPAEGNGIRAFRTDSPMPGVKSPTNPDGKPAEVLEAERRFMYQWVKNQMMDAKGKSALTSDQADQLLRTTALGRPIVSGSMTRPPAAPGEPARAGGSSMQRPPSGPTKLYAVTGVNGPVALTDEEVQKAKAAGVDVQDISSFNQ